MSGTIDSGEHYGKRIGYWYLYDKQSIRDHLESLPSIEEITAKYTEESYEGLSDLITEARDAFGLNGEDKEKKIILYARQRLSSQGKWIDDNNYYICVETPINKPDETDTEAFNEYIKKIKEREENNVQTTLAEIDNIVANLQLFEGNVNIQTDGNGTVTADKTTAGVGDTVALTVTPNNNYEIDNITVTDGSGNNVTVDTSNNTFIMPKNNVTVNATFKKIQKAIRITTENGSVTTNQTDNSAVNAGETVTLTLTPNQYCDFDTLTVTDAEGNNITVTNNTFTMPTSNVTINAKFKEKNKNNDITIETANGSVTTDVGTTGVLVETPVTITATPNYGYEVGEITVTDAEGNNIPVTNNTFKMPISNVTIKVTFNHIKKSVALNNSDGGQVSTNQADNSKVNVGDTVKLNLTPSPNYELDEVKVTDDQGNDIDVDYNDNTFTMPNSNVRVEAKYRRITKAITLISSDNGTTKVNVDNLQKVNAGDTVKITATPNDGYEVNKIIVIDEQGNTITVSSDGTFTMPTSNVIVTAIYTTVKTNNTEEKPSATDDDETTSNEEEQNEAASNENTELTKNKNNIVNSPKTGDAIVIFIALLILAVTAFVVLSKKSKNKKHTK